MSRRRHFQFLALGVVALMGALALFGIRVCTEGENRLSSSASHRSEAGAPSLMRTRVDDSAIGAQPMHGTPQTFANRLRCTGYRTLFGYQLPSEALSLMCDGKLLEAVKLLSSMAEAGDRRALFGLSLLGNDGGSCDGPKPSPSFPRYVDSTMRRAQENAATKQTLQRLDSVLAEAQAGPSEDELEACRQSAMEFRKIQPAFLEQFVSTLGRSIDTLRGENAVDVEIEYDRKMLLPGDADGELALANKLLHKGTAAGQEEAIALLRQAASTSLAAKTELARCLLNGCPTPAPDPMEARQLITDAALGGDFDALMSLSGATDPRHFDRAAILSGPEQYAWSQFWGRLNEEGCFGATQYFEWIRSPSSTPNAMGMSPVEATAAEARAAELVAMHLEKTRERLFCN